MIAFLEQTIAFIIEQGALGVFLASFLEEVIVPIPSTLVQTGAGLFFLSGVPFGWHGIWILLSRIVVPTAIGATIGSLVIYGLVYWGGIPFVKRYGKYFFLNEKKIEKAQQAILSHKSLLWAFCVLRFLPILPNSFIAAGAGLIRLPFKHYLWTTLLGIAIRASYLGAAGWLTGEVYQSTASKESLVGKFLFLGLGVVVVTIVMTGILSYAKKK